MGTNRHCDWENSWHCNWDTTNEYHKKVINTFTISLCWKAYIMINSKNIPMEIEQMQKFPIEVKTCFHHKDYNVSSSNRKLTFYPTYFLNIWAESLKTYLLKVANVCSVVHQMSCLSKKCMNSCSNDICLDFTLFTCRARVYPITWTLGYWERFTCKSRLKTYTTY